MYLGRLADSLKYLDSCVQVSYANSSCHVDKVSLLIRLQRKNEARKLHDAASRLVASQFEEVTRTLRGSVSRDEKESLESDLEGLKINQEALALYAEQL